MNLYKYVVIQITAFRNRSKFRRIVARYSCDHYVKSYSFWNQLLTSNKNVSLIDKIHLCIVFYKTNSQNNEDRFDYSKLYNFSLNILSTIF